MIEGSGERDRDTKVQIDRREWRERDRDTKVQIDRREWRERQRHQVTDR